MNRPRLAPRAPGESSPRRGGPSGASRRDGPSSVVTSNLVGGGSEAVAGRRVAVHYTGWVYDPEAADNKGRQLDSSRTRNEPLRFELGAADAAPMWQDGIAGMRAGGRRTLIVMGGAEASGLAGVVPPHAALVFDLELLEVE